MGLFDKIDPIQMFSSIKKEKEEKDAKIKQKQITFKQLIDKMSDELFAALEKINEEYQIKYPNGKQFTFSKLNDEQSGILLNIGDKELIVYISCDTLFFDEAILDKSVKFAFVKLYKRSENLLEAQRSSWADFHSFFNSVLSDIVSEAESIKSKK